MCYDSKQTSKKAHNPGDVSVWYRIGSAFMSPCQPWHCQKKEKKCASRWTNKKSLLTQINEISYFKE
jgi:hypothetical protein